jgi:hypothetical protein
LNASGESAFHPFETSAGSTCSAEFGKFTSGLSANFRIWRAADVSGAYLNGLEADPLKVMVGWKADVEALAAFRTSDEESSQQVRRSVEGGEHLHACTSWSH